MALETELKFLDPDFSAIRTLLDRQGGVYVDRHFERNAVYDDPERSLKERRVLLRVRRAGRNLVTLKYPPDTPCPEDVKVLEELQTEVADPDILEAMLRKLGFEPAFRYEKVREKWRFMDCVICLDTLPFGDFLEIEGERGDIMRAAEALRLPRESASRSNYRTLNIEHRQRAGLPYDESFVFSEGDRERILEQLARARE